MGYFVHPGQKTPGMFCPWDVLSYIPSIRGNVVNIIAPSFHVLLYILAGIVDNHNLKSVRNTTREEHGLQR